MTVFSLKDVTFVFFNTQNVILNPFTYFNDSHTKVFTHTHTQVQSQKFIPTSFQSSFFYTHIKQI